MGRAPSPQPGVKRHSKFTVGQLFNTDVNRVARAHMVQRDTASVQQTNNLKKKCFPLVMLQRKKRLGDLHSGSECAACEWLPNAVTPLVIPKSLMCLSFSPGCLKQPERLGVLGNHPLFFSHCQTSQIYIIVTGVPKSPLCNSGIKPQTPSQDYHSHRDAQEFGPEEVPPQSLESKQTETLILYFILVSPSKHRPSVFE